MKTIIGLSALALLLSCGGGGDSSSDGVFYAPASQIFPTIKTSVANTSSVRVTDAATNICDTSPSLGTVARTVCDTFESYTEDNWNNEEATLGHKVSMTNFYKFMIQTDAYISDGTKQTCEAVTGKVKVDYDDSSAFWTSTDTYSCKATYTEAANRFKAYAWDSTNSKYAVLYDHQDSSDEAMTFGSKTSTTFDLTVKSFLTSPGPGYYRRFTGNVTEHSFTMQDVTSSTPTKLVLAGLAQGVGKHFLAEYISGGTHEYYCYTIAAQANITTSTGKTITQITQLSVSAPLTTCTATSGGCGGCETDTITYGGTAQALPAVAATVMSEIAVTSGLQPTQHFKHQFDAL
jgi:hypothetical protein